MVTSRIFACHKSYHKIHLKFLQIHRIAYTLLQIGSLDKYYFITLIINVFQTHAPLYY